MSESVTLYSPVSPSQLAKIINADWQQFFLHSDGQRFFFPKLHASFAEMLARQWEAKVHSAGYVVCFDIQRPFIDRFSLETVAYQEHFEYRIPANVLDQFNRAIWGNIRLLSAFESGINYSPVDEMMGSAASCY